MKQILLIASLFSLTLLGASCQKTCEVVTNAKCKEAPPTNELCQAYYERWFYNQRHDKCEKIGYSGCTQKGFATETECNACKCNEE